MITMLRLALFLLSCFGWWEQLRRRTRIGLYFLPAVTAAVQFLALFAGGLLNFLPETAAALYGAGLLGAAAAVPQWRQIPWKRWLSPGIYLGGGTVLLALVLRGNQFGWQDNFTHWALVVKTMLSTGRFPNFLDTVITFQNYPLGSAAYLYCFCRAVGTAEWVQMLGQAFLMLQLLLPLAAYGQRHRGVSLAVLTLLTNFLLQYNIPITELLVDSLLPMAGMAAFLFVHYHWFFRRSAPPSLWWAAPLLCLTAQVKNSGLFYVLFSGALLLAWGLRNRRRLTAAAVALSPVAVTLMWTRHCDYVFPRAEMSKHALTAEYLQYMVSDKTPAQLRAICAGAAEYLLTRRELVWLLVCLAALGLMTWLLARTRRRDFLRLAVFCLGLYMLYGIGQIGMYIFSMPVEAALELECIDRYTMSADIALYCVMTAYGLSLVDTAGSLPRCRAAAAALLTLLAVTLPAQLGDFDTLLKYRGRTATALRQAIEAPISEYGVEEGYSYLLCSPQEYYDMPYFIWKYRMGTVSLCQITVTDPAQLEVAADYDYIIILDSENPVIRDWVCLHHPDQAGRQVIQCFK